MSSILELWSCGSVEKKLEHLRKNFVQRPDVLGKLSEIFRLFSETWQS